MNTHFVTVTSWRVSKFPKQENKDWEEEIWEAYELLCACGTTFKGYLAKQDFQNHLNEKDKQ